MHYFGQQMYYSKRLKSDFRPVYLVGFMASGKSTLAREMSKALDDTTADLDTEIEQLVGMSISEIFSTCGEDYFRFTEASLLRNTRADVISTGGGTPIFYKGMEYINKHGHSIFIDVPLKRIKARLDEGSATRPLASGQNLSSLYDARKKIYEQAHHLFNPSGILKRDVQDLITLVEGLRP